MKTVCLDHCVAALLPYIVLDPGTIQPVHRGFFCDDDSIKYPYKDSTAPGWAVGVVGILVPAFTVSSLCIGTFSLAY